MENSFQEIRVFNCKHHKENRRKKIFFPWYYFWLFLIDLYDLLTYSIRQIFITAFKFRTKLHHEELNRVQSSLKCKLFSFITDCEIKFKTQDFKSIVRTDWIKRSYTEKKRLTIFPSPAGMSLTELSLAGEIASLFLQCSVHISCLT